MFRSVHPIVLIAFGGVAVALIATAIAIYERVPLKPTRTGVVVSVLPSLLMLVLFYSLAIHMRQNGVGPSILILFVIHPASAFRMFHVQSWPGCVPEKQC